LEKVRIFSFLKEHLPALGLDQTEQKLAGGRFAASGFADQGKGFSLIHGK